MQAFSRITAEDLFADLPDLVSLEQAADLLGVGRTKKYELTSFLRSIKTGKQYKILKRDLTDYVLDNLKTRGD